MRNSFVTPDGFKILTNSLTNNSSQQYWIGYYALAYVPEDSDARKTGNFTEPTGREQYISQTTLVPYKDGEPDGDIIYNVFQGSMADTVADFAEGDTDAGKLYKQCLYAENIESTFRYVLQEDSNGNKFNTLVTYAQKDMDPQTYEEFYTYVGVGGTAIGTNTGGKKGLPIPAPLYYNGNSSDSEVVSADMRFYHAKDNLWDESNSTTRVDDYAKDDTKGSISNFNRYHAPSTSEGYAVAYQPACRNMAKATKLFPIEHYQVINTKPQEKLVHDIEMGKSTTSLKTGNAAGTKVGSVKYTICINLNDYLKKQANQINNPDASKTSFKFNRIGIYAVPVSLHAFNVIDADSEKCGGNKVQLAINGDSDPILFGIIDIDTVEMSEDTMATITQEFVVNFNVDSQLVDDTAIYYSLYEDDSITWYKNQLIANASIAEAVTTLTAEVGYLRNLVESFGNGGSCSGGSVCGSVVPVTQVETRVQPFISNVVVIREPLKLSYHGTSDPNVDENGHATNNPLSAKYLEQIDEIFSAGLVPVIAYHLGVDEFNPSYSGSITHYAHFCGVGRCAYMFYDAAHEVKTVDHVTAEGSIRIRGVFIRIRIATSAGSTPDQPILAVAFADGEGDPGYSSNDNNR